MKARPAHGNRQDAYTRKERRACRHDRRFFCSEPPGARVGLRAAHVLLKAGRLQSRKALVDVGHVLGRTRLDYILITRRELQSLPGVRGNAEEHLDLLGLLHIQERLLRELVIGRLVAGEQKTGPHFGEGLAKNVANRLLHEPQACRARERQDHRLAVQGTVGRGNGPFAGHGCGAGGIGTST